MKILKIVRGDDKGGVFTCEKQFISFWKSTGHIVDLIIVGDGDAVEVYQEIGDLCFRTPGVTPIEGLPLPKMWFYNLKNILNLKRYSKELKLTGEYDAVIYRRSNFIYMAVIVGKMINAKIYWHLGKVVNNYIEKIYYNINVIKYNVVPVANSIYTQKTFGDKCKYVIYPGYEEQRVKKLNVDLRRELKIPEDAVVFGTASRVTRAKAQDLLIKGIIRSGLLEKNVHLIIAGGPLDDEFSKDCIELAKPYRKKVHFIGVISELAPFYSSIDIYVNSRRDAEPFGISIAEAMGAGLPVIAYHLGGPSEMIEHELNGWLIESADEECYAKIFRDAFDKNDLWKEMGRNSEKKSKNYKATVNAERFIDIIKWNRITG